MNFRLNHNQAHIPEHIVQQAIHWQIKIESGSISEAEQGHFVKWRSADPLHELACARLLHLDKAFSDVAVKSAGYARETLQKTDHEIDNLQRRRLLKSALGTTLSVAGVAFLAEQQGVRHYLSADLSTRNSREEFTVFKNSQLWLNRHSTVEIDEHKSNSIRLTQGELFLKTAAIDSPVQLHTAHGVFATQNAEVFVRHEASHAIVQVNKGLLHYSAAAGENSLSLQAGSTYQLFSNKQFTLNSGVFDYSSWRQNLLTARAMPLADFLHELARYRSGHIRCHPSLNDTLISGVFQLSDTDLILSTVAQSVGAKLNYLTRFWAEILPK